MDEVYVRKDVFDVTLKRIEQMMAASEARHNAMAERQERQIAQIRGEVAALHEHVSGLENLTLMLSDQLNSKRNTGLVILGYIVSVSAVIVAAVQVFLAVFK